MSVLVMALLGAILAGSAGPAAAQDAKQQPVDATQGQPTKEVGVTPRAADGEIAKRLERIFVASGWFQPILVEVKEGIVFLDGATETDNARSWAGDLARRTEDVVAVVNRIEVQPQLNWSLKPATRELRNLAIGAQQTLPVLILGALVLILSWFLARGVARLMHLALANRITSPLLLLVTSRTAAIPVFLLGLYLVLQMSGLTRLALTVLGGTGVVGIVLGFAFRDIAENFLASLLLSIRNPFRAGDLIAVGGHSGVVQNLNTRSTVLLTQDGTHVQIPNALVFKSVIENFTSSPSRRADFVVGIGYEASTGRAQSLIADVLKAHEAVLADPEPMVLVDELAASTVNLRVYFWFDGRAYSPFKLKSALLRATKRALTDAGISMPDDAREVIFPQGVPLVRQPRPSSDVKPATGLPPAAPTPTNSDNGEAAAVAAEGGLDTDVSGLQRQAARSTSPEGSENLLTANDKTS
ncbi:MAG: mechanosensitive ion channel family protein [Hyphomicrobiaceae bacterium]